MKISKSTIVRTVLILIVIVNFFLEKFGVDVIKTDESFILMCVETVVEIAVIVVGFWYNNSYSKNALRAQRFLEYLKKSEE
ncbi:MAG: hypothetical protein IIX27_03680 [Ruminococcus sp.]|nr:hypothetical protein [Ruminococcus sp.]